MGSLGYELLQLLVRDDNVLGVEAKFEGGGIGLNQMGYVDLLQALSPCTARFHGLYFLPDLNQRGWFDVVGGNHRVIVGNNAIFSIRGGQEDHLLSQTILFHHPFYIRPAPPAIQHLQVHGIFNPHGGLRLGLHGEKMIELFHGGSEGYRRSLFPPMYDGIAEVGVRADDEAQVMKMDVPNHMSPGDILGEHVTQGEFLEYRLRQGEVDGLGIMGGIAVLLVRTGDDLLHVVHGQTQG